MSFRQTPTWRTDGTSILDNSTNRQNDEPRTKVRRSIRASFFHPAAPRTNLPPVSCASFGEGSLDSRVVDSPRSGRPTGGPPCKRKQPRGRCEAERLPPRSGRPPRSILSAEREEPRGRLNPEAVRALYEAIGSRAENTTGPFQRPTRSQEVASVFRRASGFILSYALPRAGGLNAESRRNAEVPWDASPNAAGRADHASQHAV